MQQKSNRGGYTNLIIVPIWIFSSKQLLGHSRT